VAGIEVTEAERMPWVAPEDYDEALERHGWAEVVDGRIVVRPEDDVAQEFGNMHNLVAHRLAVEVSEQWGVVAVSPGLWTLEVTDRGGLRTARQPDVLATASPDDVFGEEFRGAPLLVAEVWSPSNTFAELTAKRREYHEAGAVALVEAHATPATRDVRLEWYVRDDHRGTWRLTGFATGEDDLVVDVPRPFRVRPNDLLAVARRRDASAAVSPVAP
jgi:hypothetical protein